MKNIETIEKTLLRKPSVVMNLDRLGALHQSRVSFTSSLIRKMALENWKVKNTFWDLDENGYGVAIYTIKTKNGIYNLVVFSNFIKDSERSDRVIAEKWDVTFTLLKGDVTEKMLDMLGKNVPLQETGRNTNKAIVLGRANKSVRIFEYVIDSLANGVQPKIEKVEKVGYVLRTTAVYGSGKFGISDFENLLNNTDFSQSFSAEMCAVYVLREFSLDWVDHIAKNRGKKKSVKLSREIKRYLGVGNATGLGMAPYLIKHAQVVDNWLYQRELAISKVSLEKVTPAKVTEILEYLNRASKHLRDLFTIDENQSKLNQEASKEINLAIKELKQIANSGYTWKDVIKNNEKYSYEAQESIISSILELYPELVDTYGEAMTVDEKPLELTGVKVKDIKEILENKYGWAINIDFSKPDNTYWFWYVSEDKEEPRLGVREVDAGAELERPLDIARQANTLYKKISSADENQSISKFLLENPNFASITRRVWTIGNCNMGEIQANVLQKDFLPIKLLRAKLAVFGATRFDPRSDRWVQVTFFQGAPLIDEIHPNEWLFPLAPKSSDTFFEVGKDKLFISRNELRAACVKAFNSMKLLSGESDLVANMVIEAQMAGLDGIKHFVTALKYLKNDNDLNVKIESDKNKIYVDLGGCSILCHIQIIIAYALDKMEKYDEVEVKISNCFNKWLSYFQLKRLSSKGLNAKINWFNSKSPEYVEYVISANDNFPKVNYIQSTNTQKNNDLIITISKNSLEKGSSKFDKSISPEEIQDHYQNVLEESILIEKSDWNEILKSTKGILVEATEKSRDDAGGLEGQ